MLSHLKNVDGISSNDEFFVKAGDEKTCAAWEKLYKSVLEQGEISIHHSTGTIYLFLIGESTINLSRHPATQAGNLLAKKYFDIDQYSLPHEANQMGPNEMLAHYYTHRLTFTRIH